MANAKIGIVIAVGNPQQITSKSGKTYEKRSIFIDATPYNPYTGERSPYENKILFDFIGDKVKNLDNVNVGDVVEVSFDIQGSNFIGEDGKHRNYIHVRPYGLEVKQTKQNAAPENQQSAEVEQQPLQNDLPF